MLYRGRLFARRSFHHAKFTGHFGPDPPGRGMCRFLPIRIGFRQQSIREMESWSLTMFSAPVIRRSQVAGTSHDPCAVQTICVDVWRFAV
jgi:hypothetical protein